MIVMIAKRQILYPKQVCQNCLMADKSGLPRWRDSTLACGQIQAHHTTERAKVYQCQMGFNVTWIDKKID